MRISLRFLSLFLLYTPLTAWSNPSSIQITDQNGAPLPDVAIVLPDSKPLNNKPLLNKPMANNPGQLQQKHFVMDQVNKQFLPQLLIVPVNSSVNFPNNDDTRHHVYSFSETKTFELRLYHANDADPVVFDKAGLVKIGCNIHDKMRAYILVTPHSVFGISDVDGKYQWPALTAPPKTIELWHPQLEQTFVVELDQSDTKSAQDFLSVSLPITAPAAIAEPTKSSLEERLKRFKRNAQ